MVRVIPVHNFLGQSVSQIDEPTAFCTANESANELLFLALRTHCIEVYLLNNPDLKRLTTFPTVDLAEYILHCAKGEYIATMEAKVSRDGTTTSSFVRIYVNWASAVQGPGQAMRARIAGRVTPSLNRPLHTLEMIELPLASQPTALACCQSTGNLIVAMGLYAILHEFKVETQQLTRLKFIDFEARPWSLAFSFSPTVMELVEDFVTVQDSEHFMVFRLINTMHEDIDQLSSVASTNLSSVDRTSTDSSLLDKTDDAVNTLTVGIARKNTCLIDEYWKVPKTANISFINWDKLNYEEKEESHRLVSLGLLHSESLSTNINLPTINLENAGPAHALNHFILNPSNLDVVIKTSSPGNGWSENFAVKKLLQIRISYNNNSPVKNNGHLEFFTCSVMKPLYLRKECNNISSLKKCILKSDNYRHFHGVTCVICTTQEGFLYHFGSSTMSQESNIRCLTTYSFTAPVKNIVLDPTALHALTEAGLETYTLRLGNYAMRSGNKNLKTTAITEPVCLVGLRSFLGTQHLLSSVTRLVLLAKAEQSWTLYSLALPTPENLYYDMLSAAKNHKESSLSTYKQLLVEGHELLKIAKNINFHDYRENRKNKQERLNLENLYNESCALLGDYYIDCQSESEQSLCTIYYKMSKLKMAEILSRKAVIQSPGLFNFLSGALLVMKSGSEADAVFQGYNVVDILRSKDLGTIAMLVLASPVLREYATDKLINLFLPHGSGDSIKMALVLLYIQAERIEQAEKYLESVSDRFLRNILLEYWQLLFDTTAIMKKSRAIPTFSELSGTLIRKKPILFAEMLARLIAESVVSLHQVLQVFLDYLPSRLGRDGHDASESLQYFLEIHFYIFFEKNLELDASCYDIATTEAFKILVRSYLGKLTQKKVYCKDQDRKMEPLELLFANYRPHYLDEMPPFAKGYQQNLSKVDNEHIIAPDHLKMDPSVRVEIIKLQALLASGKLPIECTHEVNNFLDGQEIDGSLSIRILCFEETDIPTKLLVAAYPQAVLQYAKNKYSKETEWKNLLELLEVKMLTTTKCQTEQNLLLNQIMQETLTYLAENVPLKVLRRILPKGCQTAYQRYIEICSPIVHANHVKSLIIKTGQQLLCTLNL